MQISQSVQQPTLTQIQAQIGQMNSREKLQNLQAKYSNFSTKHNQFISLPAGYFLLFFFVFLHVLENVVYFEDFVVTSILKSVFDFCHFEF